MKENYLVMDPDNSIRWIQIDRSQLLPELYKAIGCDCVENVRTIIPDVCLIVDESGRVKHPPQKHNALASPLYLGFLLGADDIVGPAVVAAIHLVDGESDWVPLNAAELAQLRALGYPIPDPPELPKED